MEKPVGGRVGKARFGGYQRAMAAPPEYSSDIVRLFIARERQGHAREPEIVGFEPIKDAHTGNRTSRLRPLFIRPFRFVYGGKQPLTVQVSRILRKSQSRLNWFLTGSRPASTPLQGFRTT